MTRNLYLLILSFCYVNTYAQIISIPSALLSLPKTYTVHYGNPKIDGKLNDRDWKAVPFTDDFVDIEGDSRPKPYLNTRVKMLYNDSLLFIAAVVQEPHIWANLKLHDQVIFYDNDFEVFIDPSNSTHQYFEIEVNARNTIFDLFLAKPYRSNSGALISWNATGMKHRVHINGSLNNPKDTDEGWTVEMAIPFKSISIGNAALQPKENDIWRINFSRVEWETEIIKGKYVKKTDAQGKNLSEHNWVWSPQGVINMHYPERWGYIKFCKKSDEKGEFELPFPEKIKTELYKIYYLEQAYFQKYRKYTADSQLLGIPGEIKINGFFLHLKLEASSSLFMAQLSSSNESYSINQESLLTKQPNY